MLAACRLKLDAWRLLLVACGPAPVSRCGLCIRYASGAMLVFTICNIWNGLVPACPAA